MPQSLSLQYQPADPTLLAFRASGARARALFGPPPASPREECAAYDLLLRLATGQLDRVRWAVAAADKYEVEEAVAAWHAVVPAALGDWDARGKRHRFQFAVGARPKDLDVIFCEARDLARLAATGVWLYGANGLDGGAVEAALAIAGSWPRDLRHPGWICATATMPAADHWLAADRRLERFVQPGGAFLPAAARADTLAARIRDSYEAA